MPDLEAVFEDYLAALPQAEARALWCRARQPDEPVPAAEKEPTQ
jgi:hypothetical protein